MHSALYSCPILIELEFSGQVFKKYPTSGNRVFIGEQTERQDKAYSRYSQFCKRAQKWCNI